MQRTTSRLNSNECTTALQQACQYYMLCAIIHVLFNVPPPDTLLA
jgi:hypothetical protein